MRELFVDNVTALGIAFVLLLVVFGPLERLFSARRQRVLRPELGTDFCFFAGQYLLFTGLITLVLAWLYPHIAGATLLSALHARTQSLPIWAQAICAAMLGDLCVYWFHRACHRFTILWRFHAVHHSTEHLDWLAAHREHPLDGLFTQVLINLPGMVLGVDFTAIGALVVFRGMWAVFIHSNVRINVGPLRWLFGAPELHHWHHARVPQTLHNFANLAPYWDIVFGTYHRPTEPEETYPLGLEDEPNGEKSSPWSSRKWPRGYVAQLLRPFGIEIKTAAATAAFSRPPLTPSSAPPE